MEPSQEFYQAVAQLKMRHVQYDQMLFQIQRIIEEEPAFAESTPERQRSLAKQLADPNPLFSARELVDRFFGRGQGFLRRHILRVISLVVLVGLLGWIVQCSAATRNKDNWTKTTGRIGSSGAANYKQGSGKVKIHYDDPSTGERKSADMDVPSTRVFEQVNYGEKAEQPVYVRRNLIGQLDVCAESVWDDCNAEARPHWSLWALVIGAFVYLAFSLFATWVTEKRKLAGKW
jgi:hypothetical protein